MIIYHKLNEFSFIRMKPVRDREARVAGICGIFALVLGFGNVICGSILLGYKVENGDGLWSGLGMMVVGCIGVVIWWKKFRPAMLLFLVMCSMLVIALIIQIALAVIGFLFWRHFTQASDNCYIYNGACRCTTNDGKRLPIPLDSCDLIKIFDDVYLAMMILSIMSFLVTSAGSFIGCLSTCFEDLQEPKRHPTVLTQATDLKVEPVDQNSASPTQSNDPMERTNENEMTRNEENESEVKRNEYEEIVIEKTEEVPVKEVTVKDS